MTYFCSIGSQILYIFETHGIGQTPSSLERYLVCFFIDSNASSMRASKISAMINVYAEYLICITTEYTGI